MRLLMEQAHILRGGTLPQPPLMAIQWWFDTIACGHPPCPLWELPADVADEVRLINGIVRPPPPTR